MSFLFLPGDRVRLLPDAYRNYTSEVAKFYRPGRTGVVISFGHHRAMLVRWEKKGGTRNEVVDPRYVELVERPSKGEVNAVFGQFP